MYTINFSSDTVDNLGNEQKEEKAFARADLVKKRPDLSEGMIEKLLNQNVLSKRDNEKIILETLIQTLFKETKILGERCDIQELSKQVKEAKNKISIDDSYFNKLKKALEEFEITDDHAWWINNNELFSQFNNAKKDKK